MDTKKSLAGTGRLYLVPCSRFRISTEPHDGYWKVHIPKEEVRVEDNRIVVVYDVKDLNVIKEAIETVMEDC